MHLKPRLQSGVILAALALFLGRASGQVQLERQATNDYVRPAPRISFIFTLAERNLFSKKHLELSRAGKTGLGAVWRKIGYSETYPYDRAYKRSARVSDVA